MIKIVFHFSIRVYRKDGKTRSKKVVNQQPGSRFIDVATKAIEQLTASRGKSTLDNYRTALASFLRFAGQGITVERISQQIVEEWQKWLEEQGVKLNTISCYMRSLRSMVSHTETNSDLNEAFDTAFTGSTKTDKRSLSSNDLRKLCTIQLPNDSPLRFTRDIFLFSIYALGMPFVDVAFLRKKQLADGYIEYQRHKTRQPVRVKVEPVMQRIINRYSRADSPYVFPILKTGSMDEYQMARNQYNRHLRRLSEMGRLSRRLTSYVARHSWASMAYSANVDLSVISKALGHSNSKVTMTYIREIDDCRIDKANRKLLRDIAKKIRLVKT
ncbi:MAG: site-specific integrase [Prevotella sp.]|nr:site-specific integrase [Prevotella sp.]